MGRKQERDIEDQRGERSNGLVDEALGEAQKDRPLRVSDIEDIGLAVRAKVGQEVGQTLVQQQGAVAVPGPECQRCGREMHFKGLKKRRGVRRRGDVDWERPY